MEASLSIIDSKALLAVFGSCDRHLRRIRRELDVSVSVRDGGIHVEGSDEAVSLAVEVLQQLQQYAYRFGELSDDDVSRAIAQARAGEQFSDVPPLTVYNGRQVRPRTAGQAEYLRAIRENQVILCSGPAGTGKTYLAVAAAVAALKAETIQKIVLVRPAVEAGESLGYLPGDLQAKINPYLRPLMDALHDMIDHDAIRRFSEADVIEVIPLAYMRGRTLNEAFMILDEAQNTTVPQMKMFLTRMGVGSRIVVSGDTTQRDLPGGTNSGLVDGIARLSGIPGIATVALRRRDIVRHPLVQRIVNAYEREHRKAPADH